MTNTTTTREHKPFCVFYDCETGGFIDGIECNSEEEARDLMEEILSTWMNNLRSDWGLSADGASFTPTAEQIEAWDDMIFCDSVYYAEWDDSLNDYNTEEATGLTQDELWSIGWMEIGTANWYFNCDPWDIKNNA